jgi:hypothetical protein
LVILSTGLRGPIRLNAQMARSAGSVLTQRPEVADVRTSVVYEHIRSSHIQPG